MIRGVDEEDGLLKSTVENQHARYAPVGTRNKVTTFTCCNWEKPPGLDDPIDYSLRNLATGIDRSRFPDGHDRGPLTACIELALDHAEGGRLRLSHVKRLVSGLNLGTTVPFQAVLNGSTSLNADEAAISRLRPILENQILPAYVTLREDTNESSKNLDLFSFSEAN